MKLTRRFLSNATERSVSGDFSFTQAQIKIYRQNEKEEQTSFVLICKVSNKKQICPRRMAFQNSCIFLLFFLLLFCKRESSRRETKAFSLFHEQVGHGTILFYPLGSFPMESTAFRYEQTENIHILHRPLGVSIR